MYKKYFEITDEGVNFSIPVNRTFNTGGDGLWSRVSKPVFVESIDMFIDTENNDYGDLAINYDESTWDNDVDGLIYTDNEFIEQVRAFLISQGFNTDAVNGIEYSEQGMQDYGRVSCDAYDFADYLGGLLTLYTTLQRLC